MTSPTGSLNVFRQPLKLFSQTPMTGFFRDGYCHTSLPMAAAPADPSAPQTMRPPPGPRTITDPAQHAVAGIVTDEFLDYSASRGNDLRNVGLRGGCRWCLCTARWLEAYAAYRAGKVGVLGVPRVDLEATEDSVLRSVDLDVLRQFEAVKQPGSGQGGGSGSGQ